MTKMEKTHDTTHAEPTAVPGDGELRNDQLESVAGGTGVSPAQQAAVAAGRTSATPTWNAGWDAFVDKQKNAPQVGVPPSAQPKV
jgi:hypothetical protein